MGMVWGLVLCGMVYGVLVVVLLVGNVVFGVVVMFVFGVGMLFNLLMMFGLVGWLCGLLC